MTMPRTTRTITFSLSPEMAHRVDEVIKQLGRSRSEFLREARVRVAATAPVWGG